MQRLSLALAMIFVLMFNVISAKGDTSVIENGKKVKNYLLSGFRSQIMIFMLSGSINICPDILLEVMKLPVV